MPSRFQPVQPFTLEALVAMQQWSALQPARRKPARRGVSSLIVQHSAEQVSAPAVRSALSAVEPGENK